MSREARKVPANWEHPKNENGYYIPLLHYNFKECLREWEDGRIEWESGKYPKCADESNIMEGYEAWAGKCPQECDYMPDWKEEEKTHYMMYETVSEGTPISPAFDTPEKLATWLCENKASAFGNSTASYQGWLNTIMGSGSMCSCVMIDGKTINGVDATLIQH